MQLTVSECSPSELKFKNSYIDRKSLGSEKQIKKLRIKCRKGYVMKSDVTPKEVCLMVVLTLRILLR